MKRKITIVAFFLFVGLGNFAYSQCNDWKWPEDKTTAERMYVFHNDMVKNEQYEKAVAPHQWLLKNSPDLNKALYINGEKIFRGLADNTDDPVRQKVYVDSLMMMYDMRMEYCGNEISILNKKAYYAFKYSYKDRENDTTLLKLFDEVMKKSGKNMTEGNLKYYMTIIKMNKVYQKNLTDDQILERYDKIQEAIDGRIAAGKDKKQLESLRAEVDEMLSTIVTMDCELVRNTLGSKFKENPDDIATAEKIFKFMLQGKCTDDPLWLDAAKRVYIDKPSFGLAKNIALKCKNNGDDADAEQYLNSAIEITDDVAEKAEAYIVLGHMDREKGKKSDARSDYRNAVSADPDMKDAYTFIGELYMSSFNDCKEEVNRVQDRAVFLAAYKMFRMAGNSSRMSAAKEQFPSVGDIFELNMKKGESIRVGCWIGETVVIDTRD